MARITKLRPKIMRDFCFLEQQNVIDIFRTFTLIFTCFYYFQEEKYFIDLMNLSFAYLEKQTSLIVFGQKMGLLDIMKGPARS